MINITGGTITTDGNYTIHTFTSDGTFASSVDLVLSEVLVVGGGGDGGDNSDTNEGGGGGGGGGVIYETSFSLSAGSYAVTVGANTEDSDFSTLTALAGGNGASRDVLGYIAPEVGGSGGGGGGAGDAGDPTAGAAGTADQGYEGGTGGTGHAGGGGGGAGAVGSAGDGDNGGNGGVGYACSISGAEVYYGGGGGGGNNGVAGAKGAGGNGGGGDGGYCTGSPVSAWYDPEAGTANTGGGGGGGGINGAIGGSGIVIIKYLTPSEIPSVRREKPTKTQIGIYDYGKKPYLTKASGYTSFMGEITDTYVKSLGYEGARLADFKKPYLFKDYNNMMYLFDSPERQTYVSNKKLNLTTEMPRVDDEYFDSAQQVASMSNFNTYAQENYLIMGKTMPTDEELAEASEDVKTEYSTAGATITMSVTAIPYGEYAGYTLKMGIHTILYAESVYRWEITSATYGTTRAEYTGLKGTLDNTTGWETTYIPPYTNPGYYIYVKVRLYMSGVSTPCDEVIITVYPIVAV